MSEKTDAQKKAQQRYMEKFVVARVRLTKEEHKQVKEHAQHMGESINEFARRSILAQMEKEEAGQ